MSTLKVNNLQVGQDSTATNNLTWFQPGTPDGTIRLGSGNAGSATSKFTFDKDGNLTCVGTITATSVEATIDDWIVHDGDTNTKFGFPAADQFQVLTSGNERITIDSNGKLLIGEITTPFSTTGYRKVQIGQADGGWVNLARTGVPADGNHLGALQAFAKGADGTYHPTVGIDYKADGTPSNTSKPSRIEFYTTAGSSTTKTERLRITSTGHLGVGDNNPDTRLSVTAASGTDVVGKFTSTDAKAWIQFRDNSTTDTGVMIGAEGDDMMLRAGSNTRVTIKSDGKVGIMNTNPAEVLDVSGHIRVDAGTNGRIDFGDCNSSSVAFGRLYADSTGTFIGSKTNHDLILRTNNAEKARLGINGQLGVGVTANWGNSAYKGIHVHSSGGTNTYVTLTNNATGSNSASDGFSLAYSSTDINFLNRETGTFMFTSGGTERLRIDNNGRMKINHTNTSGQLDDTFLSIYDANSASGISKNYAMIALHNYGTGSPGDVAGIGFGAGSSFAYTKGSIGFARSSSYGRGDLVFCTNNDGDTTLVNDTDERMRITRDGHVLFSGVTTNNDTRNPSGITVKSSSGISFLNYGSNGSRNWRIRPDDLSAWGSLEFSVSPTDNSSTDWPDASTDVVLELKKNKDVKIHDGNLIIGTSGHGINFAAAADIASGETVSSSTLNDYEEGTWTPSNSTVGLEQSNSLWGYYQKIGNFVIANFGCRVVSNSSGHDMYIDGLPFSAINNSGGARFGGYIFYTTTTNAIGCSVGNNSSRIYIWNNVGSGTAMTHFDNHYIRGTVFLKVA